MSSDTTEYLFQTYKRWPLTFSSADGDTIYTKEGKSYLDFMSGIGTVNMGHNHPKIKAALQAQVEQGWHGSNFFHYEGQERVAKQIAEITGLDRVFFANSGAEANEAAIKLARKATGRQEIISFQQSFHGRTYGSMAATGQKKVHEGFAPLPSAFVHAPYNDAKELEKLISDETAAIFLELVQGEGGVHPVDESFLRKAQTLAKNSGALLVIDEVQTGIGRTGAAFAYQHYEGVKPDIITLAKGLGNGFPVGAMVGKEDLLEHFGPGSHGTTFGGNPLAMTVAEATLNVLQEPGLLEGVEKKGNLAKSMLQNNLANVSLVKEVRGQGLMIGIVCNVPVNDLITDLQGKGMLVLAAGEQVLRILPPLTITEENLLSGLELIIETITEAAGKDTPKK